MNLFFQEKIILFEMNVRTLYKDYTVATLLNPTIPKSPFRVIN